MSRLVQGLCLVIVGCAASTASAATVELAGLMWETDLVTAYNASLQEEKPMCVLFVRSGDYYCEKLKTQLHEHRLLAAYRDRAIFVIADVDKDDAAGNVSQMVTSLNLDRIPALVLMRTSAASIDEVSRIVGLYTVDQAAVLLGRMFDPIVFPPAPAVESEPAATLPATGRDTDAAPEAPE